MNQIALLLADPSPCLRWLVLRDLFDRPPLDPERAALDSRRERDPLVTSILTLQEPDGSWAPNVLAAGRAGGSRTLMTALVLTRLGYLGFDGDFSPVAQAADYLFGQQQEDGSWPLTEELALTDGNLKTPLEEGYYMIPLQTAFPLRGLAMCGYAADPRAENAYLWLLAQRLPDGAWPTGKAAGGIYGYVGGYRRLPHSRWGCRSNTTAALICLALHSAYCQGAPARQALDHLLGRETRETYALGVEVARMVGAERPRGFLTYFARFDLALLADLCGRVNLSTSDPRLANLLDFLVSLQTEFGLWQSPSYPQITRWLSFDLQRSLRRLEAGGDWIGSQPRTPFQPYPKRERRY